MHGGACTRAREQRWKVKHVKSFMMTKPCFHNYNISSLHHRQSCMMQPPGVGLSGNGAMLGRVMVGGMITRGVGNEQWVVTSHLEVWPLTHRVARPSPASFPRTNEYSDLFSCMHRVMPCARAGAHALPRARRLSRLPHVPWLAIGSGARGDVVVKESHPRVPASTCVVVVVG